MSVALQLLDTFLLQYNLGQALALGYVLVMLASVPLGSVRILALNTALFGTIFIAGPPSMIPFMPFKIAGIAMLVVAPMLYTLSSQ